MVSRHHSERDVCLQPGRVGQARKPTRSLAVSCQWPGILVRNQRRSLYSHADKPPFQRLPFQPRQGRPADEFRSAVQFHQTIQPDLVRVLVRGHVHTPGQDAGFNASRLTDCTGGNVAITASLHQRIEQCVALIMIPEIDLVAEFAAPSRARNRERVALEFHGCKPVVLQVEDPVAKEIGHQARRLWSCTWITDTPASLISTRIGE